jgi:transcriptional regulator with XRE-family HTH domain
MLREVFRKIKQSRGVTGKAISELTGISQNHISEYINGKRDVTSETLWRMIEAMEQLSPGAAGDFRALLPGDGQSSVSGKVLNNFYDKEASQLAEEMIKLGKALKGALNENPQLRPTGT